MWTPYPSISGEVGQQSDRLDSLPEAWRQWARVSESIPVTIPHPLTHLVRENTIK